MQVYKAKARIGTCICPIAVFPLVKIDMPRGLVGHASGMSG